MLSRITMPKKKNGFGQKFDSYAGREAEKLMASNKRHGE